MDFNTFTKEKRIFDLKLIEKTRKMPCTACGKRGPSDPHHIKSKKSGGDDIPQNLMPLCREHHTMVHKIGLFTFSQKFDQVSVFLVEHSWRINSDGFKWVNF